MSLVSIESNHHVFPVSREVEAEPSEFPLIDGWFTKDSPVFEGFVELVKTRREDDSVSIHIDPVSGRVRNLPEKHCTIPS